MSEILSTPDDGGTVLAETSAVWRDYLSMELACTVRVVYTRARRTPLQVRRRAEARAVVHRTIEVRMHAMFATAPAEIRRAVAVWIRSGRRAPRACAELDRWILASLERLPPRAERQLALRSAGRQHDLAALSADILRHELADDFPDDARWPRITWGRRIRSRTRHSLRLGSFDPDGSVVRIHPVLDQAAVPESFVRYVVFHELLHAALPPRPGKGARWIHHSAAFKKRERAYAGHAAALCWEETHMGELIRSARSGQPMRTRVKTAAAKVPALKTVAPIAAMDRSAPISVPSPKPRGFWQNLLFAR